MNTWDTANGYSNGISEEIIGKAIKKFNIPRHKLVILTKCFSIVGEEPGLRFIGFPQMKDSKDYVNQGGKLTFFVLDNGGSVRKGTIRDSRNDSIKGSSRIRHFNGKLIAST